VFTAIVVLGLLRFHASRLEYLLSNINRGIEHYSAEEMELKQVFSGLASPIKIYSYCKDVLGMDKAKNVEMVQVAAPRVAYAAEPEPQKSWRSSLFAFFGFSVN
jgi:hypothetical protein